MSDCPSSPPPTIVNACFNSMEEVNDFARRAGGKADYRQLGKGPVTSRWRFRKRGEVLLNSHQLTNRVHARVAASEGSIVLSLVPPPFYLLVDGEAVGRNQILLTETERDFVVPGEVSCTNALILPRHMFEASGQALFPRLSLNGELPDTISCPSHDWSALQVEIQNLLRIGSITSEIISHLLCRYLDMMVGETEKHGGERFLSNGSTSRVAKRARDYVEAHYRGPIRMEDLCRHTGVSVRTLQRRFSEYFQVSPFEYIKARRLNATRKALVAGVASRDQVTQIALNNGITHLGRFSVDYREHFGESPSATLARQRSSSFSFI